jgi:hypothetical protein
MGADPVGKFGFSALLAGGKLRRFQPVVGSSLVSSRFRMPSFWIGHKNVTSACLNLKFFQGFQPGIDFLVCALAGSPIHILAASLTQTPAIFAANGLGGKGQQKLVLKNRG